MRPTLTDSKVIATVQDLQTQVRLEEGRELSTSEAVQLLIRVASQKSETPRDQLICPTMNDLNRVCEKHPGKINYAQAAAYIAEMRKGVSNWELEVRTL